MESKLVENGSEEKCVVNVVKVEGNEDEAKKLLLPKKKAVYRKRNRVRSSGKCSGMIGIDINLLKFWNINQVALVILKMRNWMLAYVHAPNLALIPY